MKPPHSPSLLLTQRIKLLSIRKLCSKPPDVRPPPELSGVSPLRRWVDTGKTVGKNSMRKASAAAQKWWDHYEEFVGLVEVREAQGNVTEAEKEFMVARGIVREARENVESQQLKLKEVRDRLDRVSRDDIQYLELATLEHKLLQEEKRLRASYTNAEESEREKFALFSASVRESHEKERTRAERTKNWSIMGSILGAIIGVMGSTYINRVRLQELKNLLLEAQKGPISLQEAIHEHASVHRSQQRDLGDLIVALRNMVPGAPSADAGSLGSPASSPGSPASSSGSPVSSPGSPASSSGSNQVLSAIREHMVYTQETGKNVESLQQKYGNLEKSLGEIATDLQNVKSKVSSRTTEGLILGSGDGGQEGSIRDVILELSDAEQRLGLRINRNSVYTSALTCALLAASVPILYILLKGS
ncbi:mitochondrial potassium channel [Phyllobates terribilis]|uniref:mitochondrial potassium channel n=1 Tax=Phyllobates terribilis TaxID=111132 RepID=UPI003CCAB742